MTADYWQLPTPIAISDDFLRAVKNYCPESSGEKAAQLLWQRGIRDRDRLLSFLDPDRYHPSLPWEFGREMYAAVRRLQEALNRQERVTIWGDFDADGITATSVLWEGLGSFFEQHRTLDYYIPNRLTESHGLNRCGLERLRELGTTLIVTCDTGSTNLEEIAWAAELGIDVIITDHHSLPDGRPPVAAIINPRYLTADHPFYHLSGVAVAYKLVEALYLTLDDRGRPPLTDLLDLVAIGLIADLVQLQGDCRYLAQKGLQVLQQQTQNPTRPGIACLLKHCQRTGDRPTDISFGIGPRINAIGRIHGDASYGVELLTCRDRDRAQTLALETELANSRRKALQRDMVKSARQKLDFVDLSTTSTIVLADEQWPSGLLGLVAGQIAQEYQRPAILLSTAIQSDDREPMARGSARSLLDIDLYQLLQSQAHLLDRFGGHPLAAGLRLPLANLDLFREGIDRQCRQRFGWIFDRPRVLQADLVVEVAELGRPLFRELKCLEPYGMGNPPPTLWLKRVQIRNAKQGNIRDSRGQKLTYIRTQFEVWDEKSPLGFPGVWWGHYAEELPPLGQSVDLLVELDFNTRGDRYEVRLIDWQVSPIADGAAPDVGGRLLDFRGQSVETGEIDRQPALWLEQCPKRVGDLHRAYYRATQQQQPLALAYAPPPPLDFDGWWEGLIGQAKFLSRTQTPISRQQWYGQWQMSDRTAGLALAALESLGFSCHIQGDILLFQPHQKLLASIGDRYLSLKSALQEESFQKQFLGRAPLPVLQHILQQSHPASPKLNNS